MHCEYVVSYRDFSESIKAYRQVSKAALIAYIFRIWLIPCAAAIGAALCLFAYLKNDQQFLSTWAFFTEILVILAITAPIIRAIKLRRMFKLRTSLVDGEVSLDFDSEKVYFTVPGRAQVSYPWTSFTAYREGSRTATLFVGKAAFHTIPKSAMNEEGWNEIRSYIHAHADKS